MAKRRREESDSDEPAATEATSSSYNTVFVDTSLDTHLALIVSNSDTVSDFKKKIMVEHLRCFPEMEELKILSVKVKRKGHHYHLPDTMLVRSAFEGIKKGWFLSVDASSCQVSGNDQGLLCITYPQTEACNLRSIDSVKSIAVQKVSDTNESYPAHGNLASSSIAEQKGVTKVIGEFNSMKPMDNSQERSPRAGPVAKKRKLRHKEDVVSGFNEPTTDVANTTGEQKELTPNCDLEMPMCEKLHDASTEDPVHSYQLPDSEGAVENSFGRKKSKAKKSTPLHKLDIRNIVEASQNVYKSDQGIVPLDGSIDATTNVEIVVPKTDVDHRNKIGKEGKSPVTQGAEMYLPSDNNKATGSAKEQILSAEKTLNDKGNIGAGDSGSTKRKKKSRKKSAEKIPDKLGGEDDSRVNCPSLAAGVGPITDHVTEQTKKCEILSDAGAQQINTEVKGSAHNKEPVQVQSATCKSSDSAIAEMSIKGVETVSTTPSDLKVDEGHGNSGQSKTKRTKMEVAAHTDDVSGALLEAHNPPANHFTQGSNQDKNVLPATEKETVSATLSDLKVADGHGNSGQRKKKRSKKEVAAHTDDVSGALLPLHNPPATNHFTQGSNQDKNVLPATEKETVSATPSDFKVADGHVNTGQRKKKRSKKEVAAHTDDVSGAPSVVHPANHFVQGSNQDKNVLPATQMETVSTTPSDLKASDGHGNSGQRKKKRTKKEAAAHTDDVSGLANHFVQGSNQDKNVLPATEKETVSAAPSDLKVSDGHGNSGQSKKKRTKKESAAHTNDVSGPANHFAQGYNQDKNVLPATQSKGASEQESKATCTEADILLTEEKENEVEHLPLNQTDNNQDTLNLAEQKLKKKTKKSQKTSKKSKSIMAIQDQEVGLVELAASNDNLGDLKPLPEPMEMDMSAKDSSGKDLRNSDSFQVPSHPLAKGTSEGMHEPEVNTDKGESINFKQYFIPGQQQGEVASTKPTKSNKGTKAGKKSDKDGVTSKGTLGDICDSRAEVADPSRSSVEGDKTGKLATFDAPAYKKESKESVDESMSSSDSKGSDRFPENRKQQAGSDIQSSATKNTKMRSGDLDDITQPEKGLFPTSGPKFGDSRSKSSVSKRGEYSDSSTETPSDYSSSSGDSVEGSEISQASTPNGDNGTKIKDAGAKHKVKSKFLSPNMTIDMILRSSSRFKKAKVNASQCQDDESQPVDVVPDSLANTPNQ